MVNMKLNLTALTKSIDSLQEAIDFAHSDLAKQDERIFQQFLNSVILCFEFTYEMSWKMIKRRLKLDAPNAITIDQLNFNDLMREAAQYGLIDNPTAWIKYRGERNITSHTYSEKIAQEVYESAQHFLVDAKKLLVNLQIKN